MAKSLPQLFKIYPAAPGEQHFVNIHTEYSPNDKFLVPDNGVFGKIATKIFNRRANRYGYDEKDSVRKYDESFNLPDLSDDPELTEPYQSKSKRHKGRWTKKWRTHHKLAKEENELNEKNWIAGAIKHPGAMTRAAKRAGESNSEYEQEHKHDSGKAGDRARLALTLKHMHEVEDINELSRTMINRYLKKVVSKEENNNDKGKVVKTYTGKRTKGFDMGVAKLQKMNKIHEISKDKLQDYIWHASLDKSSHAGEIGAQNALGVENGRPRDEDFFHAQKMHGKRSAGISLAVSKIAGKHFGKFGPKVRVPATHSPSMEDKYGSFETKKSNSKVDNDKVVSLDAARQRLRKESVNESLTKGMSVKQVIDDFQKSNNSRFEGKSSEERRKQAIAAWYSLRKENEDKYSTTEDGYSKYDYDALFDKVSFHFNNKFNTSSKDVEKYLAQKTNDSSENLDG